MFEDPAFQRTILPFVSLPWTLVNLVGAAWCSARLSSRPREAWLVGAAIGLMLLDRFGLGAIMNVVFLIMPELIPTAPAIGTPLGIYQWIMFLPNSILQAAAWSLILYAAFGPGSGSTSRYLIEKNESNELPV